MKKFRATKVLLASMLIATPAFASDFPTVVRAILDRQTDGPLAEMEPDQRSKMTGCVIDTLSALPSGLQKKVVEAGDIEAQEDAFGEVVDADHAKWRQTITKACGEIATAG